MTQPKNPDPNVIFPNEYKTSVFLKNIVSAPNVFVGDYTYYDSPEHPENFEKTQVLFNYPIFGDKLVIGKFCQIAHGTTFIMGAANHRLSSVSTYRQGLARSNSGSFKRVTAQGRQCRRRQSGSFHQKAFRRRTHLASAAMKMVGTRRRRTL